MKLIRFGEKGKEQPGLLLPNGKRVETSGFGEEYDEQFFSHNGLARLQHWVNKNLKNLPAIEPNVRLGPPIFRPGKLACIGLNYRDHAHESDFKLPREPVLFSKATSAICGPYDNLVLPKNSSKTDWEVELAVVIGKQAAYVSEAEAMEYVAGYLLMNDYSEREFQLEKHGQWIKGKSCDTFAPLGPYLVTRDEIRNVQKLNMWLTVNGKIMQKGTTADMIFPVAFLVSYLSRFMTLLPGDIISTGTPSGVGLGRKPPQYLTPGDVVEYGVEGLGTAKQAVVAYSPEGKSL